MPLSFNDIKTEILARAREIDTCREFHDAVIAADFTELIAAGIGDLANIYNSAFVDDALLADVPTVNLEAAGIYRTNSSLTNPSLPVYITNGATVTITMSGNSAQDVYILSGTLIAVCNDSSKLEIKAYNNTILNLTVNDSGSPCVACYNSVTATITMTDNSVIKLNCLDSATASLTMSNNSFALLFAWGGAGIDYTLNDAAQVREFVRNQASITDVTEL